jgi:hypothetical protein
LLDGRLMGTGEVIEHYGIQLKIRSSDYLTGWQKIRQLVLYLRAINNNHVVIGDTTFVLHNLSQTTSIVCLGNEAESKRRFLFTVNYVCTIKQVA